MTMGPTGAGPAGDTGGAKGFHDGGEFNALKHVQLTGQSLDNRRGFWSNFRSTCPEGRALCRSAWRHSASLYISSCVALIAVVKLYAERSCSTPAILVGR